MVFVLKIREVINLIEYEIKEHGSIDFPIELYRVDKEHPRYVMSFHYHTNIEIIRVLKGELMISINDAEYKALPGDIYVVNSGFIHGAIPIDCVYECLSYNPSVVPQLMYNGESFAGNIAASRIRINEEYKNCNSETVVCLNSIFEAMSSSTEASQYLTLGALCRWYGVINKNKLYTYVDGTTGDVGFQFKRLKKALEFIRQNYSDKITLSDIAKAAGMSNNYFSSYFKKYTHQSPIEYLLSYRIERASSLLLTTEYDVTEVAYRCGFSDLSYFIRTFNRLKGVSPGKFRRSRYNK